MNDTQLDQMVAASAPVTEGRVASLDLRDAEVELMEDIMATTTAEVRLDRDPHLPGRPRLRYRLLAAAAVAAVIAAGVAINGQEDSGSVESGNSPTPGTTVLPRLVPAAGDLPDGLELRDAYGGQPFWAENMSFGRNLSVVWTHDGRGSGIEPSPDLEPTTVRGHQGHTCTGAVCAQLGLLGIEAGVEWTEQPGMQIYLASPLLTVGQIAGIAEGLVVEGDEVSIGTLPEGVPELGDMSRTAALSPEEIAGDGPGGTGPFMWSNDVEVVYRLADPSGALRVHAAAGDATTVADELGGEAVPSANVRGHAAWTATLPPGSVHPSDSGAWNVERRRIFWQEAPGVVATVETWGTDYAFDVLRAVAEGLHPATDGEWAEMLVETGTAGGYLPQP